MRIRKPQAMQALGLSLQVQEETVRIKLIVSCSLGKPEQVEESPDTEPDRLWSEKQEAEAA